MATEPFYHDVVGDIPRVRVPHSVLRMCRAAKLPRALGLNIYEQGKMTSLMAQSLARDELTPLAHLFAVSPHIKIGFDRRNQVDIFFFNARHMLTVDYDDSNDLGLTRTQWLRLLTTVALKCKLTFAIHETDRGLHAYCVSRFFSTEHLRSFWCMWVLACDPQYTICALKQGWRIRLSPKRAHPNDFVCRPLQLDQIKSAWVRKHVWTRGWGVLVGRPPIRKTLANYVMSILDLAQWMVVYYREQNILQTHEGKLTTEAQRDTFYTTLSTPKVSQGVIHAIQSVLQKHHVPTVVTDQVSGWGHFPTLFSAIIQKSAEDSSTRDKSELEKQMDAFGPFPEGFDDC